MTISNEHTDTKKGPPKDYACLLVKCTGRSLFPGSFCLACGQKVIDDACVANRKRQRREELETKKRR